MVAKFILLVLCISAAYGAPDNACGRSELWGRRANPVTSKDTTLQPLIRTFTLLIPDGQNVCNANGYTYFVGEEVISCDYDVAPRVEYEKINYITNPFKAYVYRNGNLLKEATARTIYHCE